MKRCLILGGAACVREDAAAALAMFTPDVVMAINDMIALWPDKIDLAVTLHSNKLRDRATNWLGLREAHGYAGPNEVWSHRPHKDVARWTKDLGGSSGLLAVKVAREHLGCSHIVLAGVPLDPNAGHVVRNKPWQPAAVFRRSWVKQQDKLKRNLRSMSGWTAQTFGKPTAAWLEEVM